MIYVRVVKREGNKTTQEVLDLMNNDGIYVSEHYESLGYKLGQEDFISLFSRKKAQNIARIEAQKTEREREIEEKLQKIKEWEAEQERKSSKFPMCLFRR